MKRKRVSYHVLGLGDGSKTGDTSTDDEDLRWWNSTGGRDLAGEESTEVRRRLDHGSVAGNVRHGRQRIVDLETFLLTRKSYLSPRDTRDTIDGEDGELAILERLDEVLVDGRLNERDERRVLAELRRLIQSWWSDLEKHKTRLLNQTLRMKSES